MATTQIVLKDTTVLLSERTSMPNAATALIADQALTRRLIVRMDSSAQALHLIGINPSAVYLVVLDSIQIKTLRRANLAMLATCAMPEQPQRDPLCRLKTERFANLDFTVLKDLFRV